MYVQFPKCPKIQVRQRAKNPTVRFTKCPVLTAVRASKDLRSHTVVQEQLAVHTITRVFSLITTVFTNDRELKNIPFLTNF